MNNRIIEIRKRINLTQKDFAARIGLSQNFVWMLEKGERIPSDRTISDICREFGVSESWLRTGAGEMLKPVSRNAEIAAFMGDVMAGEDGDFRRRLIAVLSRLDPAHWELLEQIARALAAEAEAPTR